MSSMLPQEFEKSLALIEQQLEVVFEAVHCGDPGMLESATHGLRQLGLEFARMVEGQPATLFDESSKRRVKKIVSDMAIQRENLMRRTASVDRCLDVLIPDARNATTYAKSVGSHGAAYKQMGVSRPYSV